MNFRTLVIAASLLFARHAHAGDAPAITAKNWRTHPRIVAIRALYTENQKLRQDNALKAEKKAFDCESNGESERSALRDATGRIRVYLSVIGSSDSAYTAEHHYDAQGRLRFLFVKAGAVNDSALEMRLYFDESGKRLWEDDKRISGPGYPFMTPWPDGSIARDAEKAFRAPPEGGCVLVKT